MGIAFAVFLMVFEGSLLGGFVRASSQVVDATDVDFWVTARGVPSFDFPAPIPHRFRALALGVPGVDRVSRMAAGFATWQKPDGARQTVIMIGADPGVGPAFPGRPAHSPGGIDSPDAVEVDHSDRAALGLDAIPVSVEIGGFRARAEAEVRGFGSFLGSPYVFATYGNAARFAGLGPEETTYLLGRVAPGYEVKPVLHTLQARLPNADVWTRQQFANRSRMYWLLQTGAGSALLTAGLLGFVIGVVIVSQTIYATTMEHLEEFATLKAMGASRRYIGGVVLYQALATGVVGFAVGLAASLPLLAGLRSQISWVFTPWWMPPGMLVASLLMCSIASLASIRRALTVEPGRVFRA